MSKGERQREQRRVERLAREAEDEARAEAKAAREAFFATWDDQDSAEGPALPCPECNGFHRRWADADETAATLKAFDEEWGLEHDPDGPDDRKVAVCLDCHDRSVVPDF